MNDCIPKGTGNCVLANNGAIKQNNGGLNLRNGSIKSTEKTVKYSKVKEIISSCDDVTKPMLQSSKDFT